MMQGKIGRYLARVGSWVKEPESARLKLHVDIKNKQQQIKSGTVSLYKDNLVTHLWGWWFYAVTDCRE